MAKTPKNAIGLNILSSVCSADKIECEELRHCNSSQFFFSGNKNSNVFEYSVLELTLKSQAQNDQGSKLTVASSK